MAGEARDKFALDGFARNDDVQRSFNAQHARQALRTTSPRNQPQLDFWQRNVCARCGNAVVAAERKLKPTAHRNRVDRCNNWLVRQLAGANQRQQIGFSNRFGRAKFGDVSTARESFSCAGDDNSLDRIVCVGFFKSFRKGDAQRVRKTVDRRIVEREDGNAIANFVAGSHRVSNLLKVIFFRAPVAQKGSQPFNLRVYVGGNCNSSR